MSTLYSNRIKSLTIKCLGILTELIQKCFSVSCELSKGHQVIGSASPKGNNPILFLKEDKLNIPATSIGEDCRNKTEVIQYAIIGIKANSRPLSDRVGVVGLLFCIGIAYLRRGRNLSILELHHKGIPSKATRCRRKSSETAGYPWIIRKYPIPIVPL